MSTLYIAINYAGVLLYVYYNLEVTCMKQVQILSRYRNYEIKS